MSDKRELPASETWLSYDALVEVEDRRKLYDDLFGFAVNIIADPSARLGEIQFTDWSGWTRGRIVGLSTPSGSEPPWPPPITTGCRHKPFGRLKPLPGTQQRCKHCGEWFTYCG